MKFAANLGYLYTEWPLEARFEQAARAGFEGVECAFPYGLPAAVCAAQLRAQGLQMVLINTPLGLAGEPGLAAVASQEAGFRAGLLQALDYAHRTACPRVHVMAGCPAPGGWDDATQARLLARLDWAADQARAAGVGLLLEPLNRTDMPGYAYHRPAQVLELLQCLDRPELRLQFDAYHVAMEGLDAASSLQSCAAWVGHAQIAQAPLRSAPDLAHPATAATLAALGALTHVPWLGLEYRPMATTATSLCALPAWQAALSGAAHGAGSTP